MTTVARVTHMKALPKGVSFWDYYICCRLNNKAADVLQRFEYWDSTKASGNVHAEQINEQLENAGRKPTQDTSRWVYKALDELAWEMRGSVCERSLPGVLDRLIELGYLQRRANPIHPFDHTGQFLFQERLVMNHLERLGAIVNHFYDLGRRAAPVLYAIEALVRKGVYIAHVVWKDGKLIEDHSKPCLSIKEVAAELRAMHTQMHVDEEKSREQKKYKPVLPRFIRYDLKKDEVRGFGPTSDTPSDPPPELPKRFGKFAESESTDDSASNQQNCRDGKADLPGGQGKPAETIPVITPVITNSDYTHTEGDAQANTSNQDNTPPVCVSFSPTITTDSVSSDDTRTGAETQRTSSQSPPSPLPIAKGTTISPPKDNELPPSPLPISIRPVMPTGEDGQFTPEVILQVFEARRGRRYPNLGNRSEERMRDTELEWCRKLHVLSADLWTENAEENIKLLCAICSQQENRREQWWLKRHGYMHPHQLVEKDRLHTMYDEMQRENAEKKSHPPTGDQRKEGEPSRRGISGLLIPQQRGDEPLVVVPPTRTRRRA